MVCRKHSYGHGLWSWSWALLLAACSSWAAGAGIDAQAAADAADSADAVHPCACNPQAPGPPPDFSDWGNGCGCEFGSIEPPTATCSQEGRWQVVCGDPCACDPDGEAWFNDRLRWAGCGAEGCHDYAAMTEVVCTPAGRWGCAPDDADAVSDADAPSQADH